MLVLRTVIVGVMVVANDGGGAAAAAATAATAAAAAAAAAASAAVLGIVGRLRHRNASVTVIYDSSGLEVVVGGW